MGEKEAKDRIWQVLCRSDVQRSIKGNDTLPNFGASYYESINHIVWRRWIALDLTEEIRTSAARGVEVIHKASTNLRKLPIAHWSLGQQS